jgi:hypothetical protein
MDLRGEHVVSGQISVLVDCPHCGSLVDIVGDEMCGGPDKDADKIVMIILFHRSEGEDLFKDWKNLKLKYTCPDCHRWFGVDSIGFSRSGMCHGEQSEPSATQLGIGYG